MSRETNQPNRTDRSSTFTNATATPGGATPAERGGVQTQPRQPGAAPRGDRERGLATTRETGRAGGQMAPRRGTPSQYVGAASPFSLMQRMAEDMDRLFEQFGFGRTGLATSSPLGALLEPEPWIGASRGGATAEPALWSPPVEVFHRGDDLVIRADLPGVKKEDVHVEVEDDVLVLSGERRAEHEERGDGYFRSERRYGSFNRAVALPEGVNADRCEASFKDGVLEITLPAPKQEERKTRRIEIR